MHKPMAAWCPNWPRGTTCRRVIPLAREVLQDAGLRSGRHRHGCLPQGPGLAGALLVGAGVAVSLASALGRPALPIHHLEGHLLSPFLSADPPEFPFVACWCRVGTPS